MYFGLYTGLHTCDIIAHRIETSLGRVHFDQLTKLVLASLESRLPIVAQRLAEFHDHWLRVYTSVEEVLVLVDHNVSSSCIPVLGREVQVIRCHFKS